MLIGREEVWSEGRVCGLEGRLAVVAGSFLFPTGMLGVREVKRVRGSGGLVCMWPWAESAFRSMNPVQFGWLHRHGVMLVFHS